MWYTDIGVGKLFFFFLHIKQNYNFKKEVLEGTSVVRWYTYKEYIFRYFKKI